MKTTIYLFLAFCIAVTSCKKGDDGAQGPQGEAGAKGDPGATGPVGPAGKDGSIMYAGTTTPATNIGKAGDFYLNRTSGQLYGPKTAAGWGNAIGLKGANGAAGAKGDQGDKGATGQAGSKMLSGAGVPSASLGSAGDFYLDKTNYHLYGPKTTAWGAALELKGKDGNANVRSYVFTNPWSNGGAFNTSAIFTFFATSGAFNYTAAELSDNLIQVYVYKSAVWYPATGITPFGSIQASYFIYPDVRVVSVWVSKADQTNFADFAAFQSYVDYDFKVKIFVINTTNITGITGSLEPGSPALKTALKPYLEN